MNKKWLGLAAFLIGLSAILPWASLSGGVSYSTPFETKKTSANGWIFAWMAYTETSVSERKWKGVYRGWQEEYRTVTVTGSAPFQAGVSLLLMLGLLFVLAGFADRRIAVIGGLMSLASVGYFLSVLPDLTRKGSVISLFAIGSASTSAEASFGYIPIIFGGIIAIIVGLSGLLGTEEEVEEKKEEPKKEAKILEQGLEEPSKEVQKVTTDSVEASVKRQDLKGKNCGDCSHYLMSKCPRNYSSDDPLWRTQKPCELFE